MLQATLFAAAAEFAAHEKPAGQKFFEAEEVWRRPAARSKPFAAANEGGLKDSKLQFSSICRG